MTSFSRILGQISLGKIAEIMRFKKSPWLPGAGRTRTWHHHGSHTPTSPGAILLGKMAFHTKQIRRQCITNLEYSPIALKIFFPLSFQQRL